MKLLTLSAVFALMTLSAACGDSKTNRPNATAGTSDSGDGGANGGLGGSTQAEGGAGAASSGSGGQSQGGDSAMAGVGGSMAAGAAGTGGGVSFEASADRLGVGTRLCAINQDGDLVCWDDDDVETRPGPYIGVSINQDAICTLLASGEASCIGPGNPPAGERFIAVRTMPTRACGQRADNTVVCWGEDVSGNVSAVTKAPVEDFAVSRITCATSAGKAPTCWGPTPLAPAPAVAVTRLVGSYDFVCGIGLDATIHCWGAEPYAPAGGGFSKAAMVDYLGDAWGCALTTQNALSCWGEAPITQQQRQALKVADFAVGQQAICLVLDDRSVKCFGAKEAPASLRVY